MEVTGEDIDNDTAPWHSGRTTARFLAVQGAYSMSFDALTAFDLEDVVEYLCEIRNIMELSRVDRKMLSKLLLFLMENTKTIDALIEVHMSDKWTMGRVNLISLSIIRVGICELLYLNTNECIVINEYASIAAMVLEDGEINFVNAILNKAKTVLRRSDVVSDSDAEEVSNVKTMATAIPSHSNTTEPTACVGSETNLTDSLTMGC